MKISYKRGMQKNFMVIDPEDLDWDNYECRMLLHNNIEGLLKMKMRPMAQGVLFYYDITSRQPLARMLKSTQWKADELKSFIIQITQTLTRMEAFLLKEARIILDPDMIYVEPGSGRLSLCYVPGMERPFSAGLEDLLEGFLENIDHSDRECVVLAYGLYQVTCRENYGTDDLLRLIYSESGMSDEEPEDPENRLFDLPDIPGARPQEEKAKTGFLEKLRDRVFSCLSETEDEEGDEEDLWFDGPEYTEAKGSAMFKDADMEDIVEDTKEKIYNTKETGYNAKETVYDRKISGEDKVTCHEERALKAGDTTVLSDLTKEINIRTLKALDAGVSDIPLTYYPFVIGKQENLVDFRLDDDTVSRLHLKIEREDGAYNIEDLNSTNGTTLNGALLENNEKRKIIPGDQIGIARLRFRFE